MSTQQGNNGNNGGSRDWDAWARAFESIDGPDDFAALFASGGRFCDPVTPWTTRTSSKTNATAKLRVIH